MRERAEALGLTIDLYQPFRDFEAVPEALDLRRAEAKFDVMEQLGAPTMLVCSNVSPAAIDDDALAAEHLHLLASRAGERGLRVAYEALAWGRHVNDYAHAWDIVAAADHPALGTCLDSFHILSVGSDLARLAEIPGERIFYLQLADAPRLVMDVLQWSRHYRCFPGQGALRPGATSCDRVLATGLRAARCRWRSSTTSSARPTRSGPPSTRMRSLLVLERPARPHAPCPDSPRLDGFAFVELGVDADSAPETEALLQTLGFAHVGPHRSKPVQLWQHGEIRLVLNHGVGDDDPEVVAVAVESADPARSAARAEALCAPVLDAPPQPGRGRPRRGRGARRHRRCSSAPRRGWLDDFLALGPERRRGPVPISRIDHIMLAQPFDAFDEAGLFYRSVLGLRPGDSAELAAPGGLLRSRALRGGGGCGSRSTCPAVAGAHAGASCSTWPSRATTCSRPPAACASAASRCCAMPGQLLRGPRGALRARARTSTSSRGSACCTTATPGGELLQFYTEHGRGPDVLRGCRAEGGYDGYGAVNSPVRLAAQQRPSRRSPEHQGGERSRRRRPLEETDQRRGRFGRDARRRSASCPRRPRCAG